MLIGGCQALLLLSEQVQQWSCRLKLNACQVSAQEERRHVEVQGQTTLYSLHLASSADSARKHSWKVFLYVAHAVPWHCSAPY